MIQEKPFKRIIALFLILLLVISLSGCGSNEPTPEIQNNQQESQTASPTYVLPEGTPASSITGDSSTILPVDEDEASAIVENEEPEPTATPAAVFNGLYDDTGLTSTQRNSINMLNYMSALTQRVNTGKGNQLFLESAYNSFDNLFPNAVDTRTQAQITNLMDTIQNYRMIAVKRDRLEYIYEQNRAQAMRQAIPNPVALLSVVQSGSLLKAAVSVLYMAVDSVSSYQAATSQADLQFIKDGWELDDAQSAELHNSTKNALSYLLNMVRDYDLPGDYALSRESIEDFVLWSSKPDSQLVGKIAWLESHQETYNEFGPYWLEIASDYFKADDFANCLDAIRQYETVSTRIFRKDIDYANALPMAIISAKETLNSSDYISLADRYCSVILANTKDSDWSIRYFCAQVYMDLYALTNDSVYLDKAYKIAFDNVVVLVDRQRELNAAYLAEVQEAKPDKDATKREKDEITQYNELIKEERKIALPPVNEAFYLNCDLLFALSRQRNISATEQRRIESILHENGENIFLTDSIDAMFWFNAGDAEIDASVYAITFEGGKLTLPAVCVSDRSSIIVTITGTNGTTTIDDWAVIEVKRPTVSAFSDFSVIYESTSGKAYKYQAGDTIVIHVLPVRDTPEEFIEFKYTVLATKNLLVFDGIKYERVTE